MELPAEPVSWNGVHETDADVRVGGVRGLCSSMAMG